MSYITDEPDTLEKELILLKHNELYQCSTDSDVQSNIKLIHSALSEGDLDVKIEDDILKYIFAVNGNPQKDTTRNKKFKPPHNTIKKEEKKATKTATDSQNDHVLNFIKDKYKELKTKIITQIVTYGVNVWLIKDVNFGKYKLKFPHFPNPTTFKLQWVYNHKTFKYEPRVILRDKNGDWYWEKRAHVIVHNEPDFYKRKYNSIVSSCFDIIQAYRETLKNIGNRKNKFPKFIIKEKPPQFKTLTEYSLMNLHLLNKFGLTGSSGDAPPTMGQVLQTPIGCDQTGQSSHLEGDNNQMVNTFGVFNQIERGIPELYKNDAFTGVKEEFIKLDSAGKLPEELRYLHPSIRMKQKGVVKTLRVSPYSEIEWLKPEVKDTDMLQILSDIKKERINTEFGRIEARRTKTGSQLENKNINYNIHYYKNLLETTYSRMIVSTIFASEKEIDTKDEEIYTKVSVFINSDDIIGEDLLKFLINLFKGDFKILRHLIKSGTGVDIYEIKFGKDFDENEIDEEDLNILPEQQQSMNGDGTLKEKGDIFKTVLQKLQTALGGGGDGGGDNKKKTQISNLISLLEKSLSVLKKQQTPQKVERGKSKEVDKKNSEKEKKSKKRKRDEKEKGKGKGDKPPKTPKTPKKEKEEPPKKKVKI